MEEDLVALMERAGFANVQVSTVRLKRMSVSNWLTNSGLPQATQDRIFDMHMNASDYFKRVYDLIEADGDCFIDMKMAIVIGVKL